MSVLQSVKFADEEWTTARAGGVLAMFNGKERPWKYEPESQSVKHFGMMLPEEDLSVAVQTVGSPGLTGDFIYSFVEVDTKGVQGEGSRSGPPRDSEGQEITCVGENVTVTLPTRRINDNADELWIYRSADGGAWPVLGRIATVSIGTRTYLDTGDTPDFTNYPLGSTRAPAPNLHYPFKLKRRLFGWSFEELNVRLLFALESNEATYISGDPLDHGCVGMVIYPDGDTRGYLITNYHEGSPGVVIFQNEFEGTVTSPDSVEQDCRICFPSGRLVWSEPDDYENFPAANVRYVEKSASDRETGAASIAGRGLLFTVEKSFVLVYDSTPAVGSGQVAELSAGIGCLSHRTIQDAGGVLMWLSDGGIAISQGGMPSIISDDIYPLFDEIIRDSDGRASRAFAMNWRQKKQYLCFVPQDGDSVGCSRAIVVDYKRIPGEPPFRFTIYEFDTEFVSGAIERHVVTTGDTTNYLNYPVLGDRYGYVWSFGIGDADGPESGTVTGTIDVVTTSPPTLTDNDASFDTSGIGLAGVPCIVRRASDGEEQTRIVSTTAENSLSFRDAWGSWTPTAGDTYRLGGIYGFYETPWSHLGAEERPKKLHKLHTSFAPQSAGTVTPKVYLDLSGTEVSLANEGATLDMTEATGRLARKLSGKRGYYVKLRWENRNPNEPFKLRHATLEAEADES